MFVSVRVFDDSWCDSVKAGVAAWKQFGILFAGVIKTAQAKFPKKYLETKMKSWLAGSHLILEKVVENVDVIAIGYKYNLRKVICFVFYKQAGITETTDDYRSKWKDEHH